MIAVITDAIIHALLYGILRSHYRFLEEFFHIFFPANLIDASNIFLTSEAATEPYSQPFHVSNESVDFQLAVPALLTCVATELNSELRFVPSKATATMITTAISANINPYSTAVAPSSSLKKLINFAIFFSFSETGAYGRKSAVPLFLNVPVDF